MPERWKNNFFSECAYLVTERCDPDEVDPNTPCVSYKHVGKDKLRLIDTGKSSEVVSSKFKFKSGDILFGRLDAESRKVVRPHLDGICSTEFWVVRSKPGTDQGFLFYWMASKDFIKSLWWNWRHCTSTC